VLSHPRDGAGRHDDLIACERAADGTVRLRAEPLRAHASTLLELLDTAAARAPDRAFLVERDARDVWHELTFANAAVLSRRIGAALRALGASVSRPLLILSGNGIDHALMTFGALRAGIPVVPVAARVGRADKGRVADHGAALLRAILDQVRPGAIVAREATEYAAAREAVAPDVPFVTVTEPPRHVAAVDFASLKRHAPLGADVAIEGETIARVLFGEDAVEQRGVVHTHATVCATIEALAQRWPFLEAHPPVLVDRLPWSGAFGGTVVFGIALRHAGTLYVDDGRVANGRRDTTDELRSSIAPTVAFDVPSGWSAWVDRLRADDALRKRWLTRLEVACWTGAPLAPAVRDALHAMGVRLASAWGTAEATPLATLTGCGDPPPAAIGAPVPGIELKLMPRSDGAEPDAGERFEVLVRGPQVTTGYWWRPDLAASAFDAEGFARTGDLVRPLDIDEPRAGLLYAGRADDRFKLSSGAWVRASDVRRRFLDACPDAADAVVSGEGRDVSGVLVWLRDDAHLAADDARAEVSGALRSVARDDARARLRRALIVDATTAAHPDRLQARLHASEPDADVIVL
jgi:feruloyl-CoA synthase